MNRSWSRVICIAQKEWRLNLRFPTEYLASNLSAPLKSGLLMYLLYRGLLSSDQKLGNLDRGNYALFVLLGSTCHSLFSASLYTFRSRMVVEKFWQTISGTLASPASQLETTLGFILGSGAIHYLISLILIVSCGVVFNLSIASMFFCFLALFFLSLIGFGLGLIGTAFSLCWEGRVFIVDYFVQFILFLSCFYYPIETLPSFLHPLVHCLPTYQVAQWMQQIALNVPGIAISSYLVTLSVWSLCLLVGPALLLGYSVKRFGMVGY